MVKPQQPLTQHLLADVLRAARERAGLTQSELARLCDLSQPAVAGWESGKRPIQETTLEKVAAAIGLGVEEMLYQELSARRRAKKQEEKKVA